MTRWRTKGTFVTLLVVSSLLVLAISRQGAKAQTPGPNSTPEVLRPSFTGGSDAFANYARDNARADGSAIEVEPQEVEVPNQFYIPRVPVQTTRGPGAAAVAPPSGMFTQTTSGVLPVTPLANYTGLGNGFNAWTNQGLLPPDTTMAVGNNQIVQWVNLRLTILNKTNGALLLGGSGYVNANQIWQGLPATSLCRTQNRGDPMLQYDRLTSRWILHQFAFDAAFANNAMCFAVSQTNDATGAYNLYEYSTGNRLPDYPKIGVWPDALYLTANDFPNGGSYGGSRACAFDKIAMSVGAPAPVAVCFTGLSATHFSFIPADFEGTTPPPLNAAAYFIGNDWFTKAAPPYFVLLWRFHADFVNPGSSTFDDGFAGGFDSFQTMPFNNTVVGSCGDNGGACVPQPGTVRLLDTLSMRMMYRAAYRNLGVGRESIVATESVDPTGAAVAGIQLLEIRNPASAPPTIYNNVNFNPDATNRWMGAAATDKLGNIGLGYSASSATISPSIRISGRLRNDIKSTLRGEMILKVGTGSQTSTAQRWGDYSTMQIDPDDDCTFWYTTEYMNNTSSANWATQIVSFKFTSCR